MLKDCSEIKEAAQLFTTILQRNQSSVVEEQRLKKTPEKSGIPGGEKTPVVEREGIQAEQEVTVSDSPYRDDRLKNVLQAMCSRGGFQGALVADNDGLPLTDFNSPMGTEILAAYTSVLGRAMERAAHLLNQEEADNISMDINFADKIVLRRFYVHQSTFFLMVICQQTIDERAEIELSIEQVKTILTESGDS